MDRFFEFLKKEGIAPTPAYHKEPLKTRKLNQPAISIMGYAIVRITILVNQKVVWQVEHSIHTHDSQPAKYVNKNTRHSYTWKILTNVSNHTRTRKNLETIYINLITPSLNYQLKSNNLFPFRNKMIKYSLHNIFDSIQQLFLYSLQKRFYWRKEKFVWKWYFSFWNTDTFWLFRFFFFFLTSTICNLFCWWMTDLLIIFINAWYI